MKSTSGRRYRRVNGDWSNVSGALTSASRKKHAVLTSEHNTSEYNIKLTIEEDLFKRQEDIKFINTLTLQDLLYNLENFVN